MRPTLVLTLLVVAGIAWHGFATRGELAELPGDLTQEAARSDPAAAQAYVLPVSFPTYVPIRNTTVGDPILDASVALLADLDSGTILYEKNATTRVPIASLTKLLSALVARDLFTADEVITVASTSIRVDREKQTLYAGEQLAMRDLIAMMLMESSNDAAYAFAAAAKTKGVDFVARMNERAAQLRMTNCVFKDPAGLDDTAHCTASDLVRLVRAIGTQAPELWPVTTQRQLDVTSIDGSLTHHIKSTDELLGKLPGIVGGKTGNTSGALGCLVLLVQAPNNRDILVSVILGSRARFTDTTALIQWAGNAYRW